MNYPDAMVDIETLGTRVQNDHVILSVGLVAFDLEIQDTLDGIQQDVLRSVEWRLNVGEQGDRHIDGGTVLWWLGQSDAARESVIEGRTTPLTNFFNEFERFIHHFGISRLWGNGPSFDNNALRHLWSSRGRPFPLKFWCDRDLRTVQDMYERATGAKGRPKIEDSETDTEIVSHSAIDDAMKQVLQAQFMGRRIRGG